VTFPFRIICNCTTALGLFAMRDFPQPLLPLYRPQYTVASKEANMPTRLILIRTLLSRTLLSLALLSLGFSTAFRPVATMAAEVTYSTGRVVQVPDQIAHVLPTGPPAAAGVDG
jgi:hypothetical protein